MQPAYKIVDTELLHEAKEGNQEAINFVLENYSFIVSRAVKSYYLTGSDSDDLTQEGMIGLYKAIRDYQASKGLSFKNFADLCVRRHIISAIKSHNRSKHIPLNYYISIYESPYEGSTTMLIDRLKIENSNPENNILMHELIDDFRIYINRNLSKLEKSVLLLYLSGLSYKEISATLSITYKSADSTIWRVKEKIKKSRLLDS